MDTLTPWITNTLRLGAYQILMLDQIPDSAATNESVELAKRFGHPGTVSLTNGVLRNIIRKRADIRFPAREKAPVAFLSTMYSYPEWIAKRWFERYGIDAAEELCKAGNESPALSIRVNRLKTDPGKFSEELEKSGVSVEPGRYLDTYLNLRHSGAVRALKGYHKGWFQVQDESAGLSVALLDPQPGETVVDLCCAPGGKTGFIAELMQDQGRVLGVDLAPGRLKRLKQHRERLGLSCIIPVAMDGRLCKLRRLADRVLVDAPCSGLGTVARRTELRWRRSVEDIATASKLQTELLEHGSTLVKPGGVLVYSTCTIEPEENSEIAEAFSTRHPEYTIEAPETGAVGELVDGRGMLQTLPSEHGIDGSFAVKFRRQL